MSFNTSYRRMSVTEDDTTPLLPEIIHPKTTPDFYRGICDKLIDDCEDNDGLDIYQITAFLRFYSDTDEQCLTWKYIFYCFKSLVCASIQTIGMGAFIYNVVINQERELVCSTEAPIELRILATLFSTYISLQMVGQIRVLKNDGLYENIAFSPPFVASEWLYIGLYCNFFSLLGAIYGSFIIIYVADSSLDIVLNSIALYFIMDLDNLMIDHFDYLRVKNWMKKKFVFEEHFDDDWFNTSEGNVQFMTICCMELQISGRDEACGYCTLCWVFFGGLFIYFVIFIGIIGAIFLPVVIAVCY
eukprot:422464_1